MSIHNIQKNKGFTIIETLVAVFILSVAITGPLVFAQSGLRAAFLARDQITALFLAQDAMETIKNMRDTKGLTSPGGGVSWLTVFGQCVNDPDGCEIDTTPEDPVLTPCSGSCRKLRYNQSNGYQYNGSSSDETIFKRTVYINQSRTGNGNQPAQYQIRVVVKVTWQTHERIGERSIVVQENLFNWIQ